jgi:hypothetical protein
MDKASLHSSLRGYPHADLYLEVVDLVQRLAPASLQEVWGAGHPHRGVPDFRLSRGRYRVIGVFPRATRVHVFMEWCKIFQQADSYADDPDFAVFEDAFGYLGVNENWNQPWNVFPDTDLHDPYVGTFLSCGMRLLVKEICRRHPEFHPGQAEPSGRL